MDATDSLHHDEVRLLREDRRAPLQVSFSIPFVIRDQV